MPFDHDNATRPRNDDGSHECENFSCTLTVPYDDEPYCFEHSPDSGSMFIGYSYKLDTFHTNHHV